MIDLDECVINALNLFTKHKAPKLNLKFKHPLVVGSGNAGVTGRILFKDTDAIFADESTYKNKLKNIDGAVLISASGKKHAPIIAKYLKGKLTTVLITCNPDAPAADYVNKTFVFPRATEPYSYNTSTYLGMILGKTKEKPKNILAHIKKIKLPKLSKYNAYTFIMPAELSELSCMFRRKFDELFGPKLVGRFLTFEDIKHGRTIIPSDKELFISFGYNNKLFGSHRLNITMPRKYSYGTLMAVGYYIMGKIQKAKPPWFKRNIVAYCKFTSKVFKQNIKPVVEGEY